MKVLNADWGYFDISIAPKKSDWYCTDIILLNVVILGYRISPQFLNHLTPKVVYKIWISGCSFVLYVYIP